MIERMHHRERLDDLLVDRALFGLSRDEQVELESLLPRFPNVDPDCFERIAATVDLALGIRPHEPLPRLVESALRREGAAYFAREVDAPAYVPAAAPTAVRRKARYRESFAWCLAVVATLAALCASFRLPLLPVQPATAAHQRGEWIRHAVELKRANWKRTEDPAATRASGDLVWSSAEQRGFMRFVDLRENDPRQCQYQLWIFDAEQDERYPIDGGVFDIEAGGGEAIVPIRAKLKVVRPVMFAVTVERPGGVVVSSRERICLLAKFDG